MDEIETGEAGCAFMLGKLDRAEFHRRLTEQLGLSLTPDAFFALWTSIIAPNNNINSLLEGLKKPLPAGAGLQHRCPPLRP